MEKAILDFISTFRGPFLDKIALAFNYLGKAGFIFIVVGIIFFIKKDNRKIGTHIFLSLIFCLLFGNLILKPLVARIRPYDLYDVDIIIKNLKDYSFPSGHTFSAFATAFTIDKYRKGLGAVMMVFATLMGVSRLYLYVHYPTDILAGILLGYICYRLANKVMTNFPEKIKQKLY